jgi:uncharacterized lipoprotein YbaY
MNLRLSLLISLSEVTPGTPYNSSKECIHLSTVAVREGTAYSTLPPDLSLNAALVQAVADRDSKKIAEEIVKAHLSEFGLEHDEAIIAAYCVDKKLLPQELLFNQI